MFRKPFRSRSNRIYTFFLFPHIAVSDVCAVVPQESGRMNTLVVVGLTGAVGLEKDVFDVTYRLFVVWQSSVMID